MACKMKTLICLVFCVLAMQEVLGAMSEAQLKAALKLVRNVCQPKNKATDDQINGMHKGDWNQDKNGQCYMYCILNMYKLMTKDNGLDLEGGIATINNQAPESMRKYIIDALTNCKDAIKTPSDKCAAGFELARCIYFENPERYFLP